MAEYNRNGTPEEHEIQPDAPVMDVPAVHLYALWIVDVAASAGLAGRARLRHRAPDGDPVHRARWAGGEPRFRRRHLRQCAYIRIIFISGDSAVLRIYHAPRGQVYIIIKIFIFSKFTEC